MGEMGMALMGTGEASGENRAVVAAQNAISSPLLEDVSIEGATGILINITGPSNMTLFEINEASSLIQEAAHEDANIIFGAVIDDTLKDIIRITVIATGFNKNARFATSSEEEAKKPREAIETSIQPLKVNLEKKPPQEKVEVEKIEKVEPRKIIEIDDFQIDDTTYDVPTFLRKQVD